MKRFSLQRYHWDYGSVELGPIERVYAVSNQSAAEATVGHRLECHGVVERLELKVWRYGKAKGGADAVRYWRTIEDA